VVSKTRKNINLLQTFFFFFFYIKNSSGMIQERRCYMRDVMNILFLIFFTPYWKSWKNKYFFSQIFEKITSLGDMFFESSNAREKLWDSYKNTFFFFFNNKKKKKNLRCFFLVMDYCFLYKKKLLKANLIYFWVFDLAKYTTLPVCS
jgi:hypothetical protein